MHRYNHEHNASTPGHLNLVFRPPPAVRQHLLHSALTPCSASRRNSIETRSRHLAARGSIRTANLAEEERDWEQEHAQEEVEEEQVRQCRCQLYISVEATPRIRTRHTGSRYLPRRHCLRIDSRRSIRDSIPKPHMHITPRRRKEINRSSDRKPSTDCLVLVSTPAAAVTPKRHLGRPAGRTTRVRPHPLHFRTRHSRCWGLGRLPLASVCLRRQNRATI